MLWRRWSPRLLAKFLLILTPIFLILAVPGITYLVNFELRTDGEALAARVGNNAARTASALARHDIRTYPGLARDLIAPLAADRAFVCAELRSAGGAETLVAWPPSQGCLGPAGADHELVLPVGETDGSVLRVRFSDTELREAERLQTILALSVVSLAFLIALLASAIGFRYIVGRPLRLLLESIRHSAETGERKPIGLRSKDALGRVIAAFDDMLQRETERETALNRANVMLRESKSELTQLNRDLERRVVDRTRDLESEKLRAETANEAKSLFLRSMSHELRTPLNAIIGFSELMKDESFGPLGNEKYSDFAKTVHSSGHHLLDIINNILDIAKIESGTEVLREETVDIGTLVEECQQLIRPMCAAAEVRLDVRLFAKPLLVRGDLTKLKQIVINLLGNAVKFTPEGGSVELSTTLTPDGDVEIVIADTGIGMSEDNIAVALSSFGQVDNSLSRRYEGTGLGLPLAKMLTELHDGKLVIDSTPGKGTRMTVCLPRSRVDRGTSQAA